MHQYSSSSNCRSASDGSAAAGAFPVAGADGCGAGEGNEPGRGLYLSLPVFLCSFTFGGAIYEC